MTLAERLLAGEHHGCATWMDVAAKFGCNERTLRTVRKILAGTGRAVGLQPAVIVDGGSHGTKPEVHFCAGDPVIGKPDKWPSVAAFDAGKNPHIGSGFEASDFRNPEALPYTPPVTPMVHRLTRDDCPDGALILWASDIHIPIHDDAACRLMVECSERNGVTNVIAGGDIFDFNCLSKHAKESRRTVEHATIMEEVAEGRWLTEWFATKKTKLIIGNHEDRAKRFIDENPALHGSVASNFAALVGLPAGIDVVPQGGEVRLGNLSARHLDAEFKNSSGGKYPAQKVLDMLPDQSTIGGHVHRIAMAVRTTRDEDGIRRTRRAWTMGHMSQEHMHYGYVSTTPNWQQGFGFIRVYWENDRPRFGVYQIEVLRDARDRPYFEFGGVVYR